MACRMKIRRNLPCADEKSNPFAVPKLGYTRREAAMVLGISVESLDRLVGRGLLRPSRALRRPLFTLSELERFLNATQA
jgi:hypothetical protein